MNKYKRRHKGDNLSRGMYWILFAVVVAYIIYKIVVFKRNVSEVQQMEKIYNVPAPDVLTGDTLPRSANNK